MKRRITKNKARARKGKPHHKAAAKRRPAARRVAARARVARKPAKKAARTRRPRETTLVASGAIARATGRAQASVRAELRNKTHTAERITAAAISEAEEVSLLLEEESGDDDEEESPSSEEDQYFLKTPLGPPHPRVRPAPGIESGRLPGVPPVVARKAKAARKPAPRSTPAGRPAAGVPRGGPADSPGARAAARAASAVAPHLFPRNLKLAYPVAARAEGVFIEDTEGRRYLDACSGAVVCSIGHGVREVAEVMTAQARRLAFAHSSQFITRETMELSARIAALAPGDMKKTGRVYLVSGGSEAVETAIKMARQFHVESGRPSKHKVITRW